MDLMSLVSLCLVLAMGAAVGGLMAGLLGVGGGIIFVPVLFTAMTWLGYSGEITMHIAVATSLALIILTSISSVIAHHSKSAVDLEIIKAWAPFIIIGAIVGGLLARVLDASVLQGVFGIVAILAAINLMMPVTKTFDQGPPRYSPLGASIPAGISFISTLMGIGGGTLSVPTLTAFQTPVRIAVGTSAAIGFFIAVPGTLAFMVSGLGIEGKPPLTIGYVNVLAVVVMAPLTMSVAPLGAKLAHNIDPILLKRAFALFLIINGARMFYETFF